MTEHVWPFSVDDETQLHSQEKATCEGLRSVYGHMTGQEFLTAGFNGFDWRKKREEVGCVFKIYQLTLLNIIVGVSQSRVLQIKTHPISVAIRNEWKRNAAL